MVTLKVRSREPLTWIPDPEVPWERCTTPGSRTRRVSGLSPLDTILVGRILMNYGESAVSIGGKRVAAARCLPRCRGVNHVDWRLHRPAQQESQAIHLDCHGQRGGDSVENAFQVDVDHLLPVVDSELVEKRDWRNAALLTSTSSLPKRSQADARRAPLRRPRFPQ